MQESRSQTSTDSTAPQTDEDDFDDDEWANYVPEPIYISEERRQEAREELDRYLAELLEETGEPSPEEMAQAEAIWRPIEEHLKKNSR